jgi:hypothetical protein
MKDPNRQKLVHLGRYELQRGQAKLSIDEAASGESLLWVLRPHRLYAYEILPPEIAEYDRVRDGIALLHEAQEWLSRRRAAVAEERGRCGKRALHEPSWSREILHVKGYAETILDLGQTYEEKKGLRHAGSNDINTIFV